MVIHKSFKKAGGMHARGKGMVSEKDLAGNTKAITQSSLVDQGQGWRWASQSGVPAMYTPTLPTQLTHRFFLTCLHIISSTLNSLCPALPLLIEGFHLV